MTIHESHVSSGPSHCICCRPFEKQFVYVDVVCLFCINTKYKGGFSADPVRSSGFWYGNLAKDDKYVVASIVAIVAFCFVQYCSTIEEWTQKSKSRNENRS